MIYIHFTSLALFSICISQELNLNSTKINSQTKPKVTGVILKPKVHLYPNSTMFKNNSYYCVVYCCRFFVGFNSQKKMLQAMPPAS